jgi:TPR repeat protein
MDTIAGRRAGPPPSAQQGHGGLRPPGLDRSLLNPVQPRNLPQDNPFPTFPAQKTKQPTPTEAVGHAMAQMNMNGNGPSGGNGAHGRPKGGPSSGQAMPQQRRSSQPDRPENNPRQDSGHFEASGRGQRYATNQPPHTQRPPPMNLDGVRGPPPPQRSSDPKSPSHRAFGPNTQRSVTMPQNLPSAGQGHGLGSQQHWAEPGAVDGYHGPESPAYIPPRPSTAGGSRHGAASGPYEQRPPMPQTLPSQHQQQAQYQQQQHYHGTNDNPPAQMEENGALDTFYDDYYEDGHNRRSLNSTLDMPDFDAIPDTSNKHRRGDSIDDHLSPAAGPPYRALQPVESSQGPPAINNDLRNLASRSRSQPDLNGQYANDVHEMAGDMPPVPILSRANTDLAGNNGLPTGARGRAPPPRGTPTDNINHGQWSQSHTPDQSSHFDPRYGRQPPSVHRAYSDQSAYSEPPLNSMRNNPSPAVRGQSIPRPGTAAPASGGLGSGDPLGRRPGTAQGQINPDALPAHPAPVRAGLVQQNQQQQQQPAPQTAPPGGRPAPVRQYNSEPGRRSIDGQRSVAQRQSAGSHPVTFDELNRLRNTFKTNPSDIANGMVLAKRLVEASNILIDEGGTADTRTKNKNREKFVLEAHKTIKKLVNSGSPDAMFYLADCYGQGLLGLQVDTKEAFALYQSAAKGGHAASAYRTAVCCEMGHEEGGGTKRDPLKAVQWYRRAAALGDTPALYKMGMILLKGLLGQQKNFGEAINMLKRAADRADRDNPHALHELALIYEAQTGNERIIRDEAYALQLFHQAAELGYKFSQFRLGQAYEYGLLGCQIDARTSIAWYTKAAAQEEHQSELALSGWYLTGTSGILEQSDTEAYLWARKAACAEPPLPKALFAMGYFTEVGIGCPRSLDEAKRWYGRAAGKHVTISRPV